MSRASNIPAGYWLAPMEATEAMIEAYLTANNAYWCKMDELPSALDEWRGGTTAEATRVSLQAALAAAPPVDAVPGEPVSPEVEGTHIPNVNGFEQWYVDNAFDYARDPVGSRDCWLQRKAWHAALAASVASRAEGLKPATDGFWLAPDDLDQSMMIAANRRYRDHITCTARDMYQAVREDWLARQALAPAAAADYSGGHTSAVAAIEGARRFGPENIVLVNHDIHFSVEGADIKRFKQEVSDYLGVPVTYVSHHNADSDQFDVCVQAGAFKVGNSTELCTSRLKTQPFMKWLPLQGESIVYYGFDPHEKARIQRRTNIMAAQGYRTDYPVALWGQRTLFSTEEIGIRRPNTYAVFKHGNCVGCLKAGWQHWYIVFRTRPDIWLKAKWAEEQIGYAIHHDESGPVYLEDMEEKFATMQAAGVPATEQVPHQRWWADARKVVKIHQEQERATACDECSQ